MEMSENAFAEAEFALQQWCLSLLGEKLRLYVNLRVLIDVERALIMDAADLGASSGLKRIKTKQRLNLVFMDCSHWQWVKSKMKRTDKK